MDYGEQRQVELETDVSSVEWSGCCFRWQFSGLAFFVGGSQVLKTFFGGTRMHSRFVKSKHLEAMLFLSALEWIRSFLNRTELECPQKNFSAWPKAAKGCEDLSSLKL